jgi:hypothetical protein
VYTRRRSSSYYLEDWIRQYLSALHLSKPWKSKVIYPQ